jgi:hypothetical protein
MDRPATGEATLLKARPTSRGARFMGLRWMTRAVVQGAYLRPRLVPVNGKVWFARRSSSPAATEPRDGLVAVPRWLASRL